MTTLVFPERVEDLGPAFDNAISRGIMQRERMDQMTFFLRHEFLASDAEDGVPTHDWFINMDTKEFFRVPRAEVSE